MFKSAGLLNRIDARAWARYWTSQGYTVRLDKVGRFFHCYLNLERGHESDGY